MKNFIIMIMLTTLITGTGASVSASGYQPGDKAGDFKLKNIDGKWVSLSDYSNAKGFIIIFTCNHCPYAKAYEDRIIALDKKYAPLGFPVIAINPNDAVAYPDDSFENMQKRAKEKGFTFPYLYDEEQKVYPMFGATRTPHIFVLSKSGTEMTVEYIGAIDDNYEDASKVSVKYVENAVDALLNGKKPETTLTKAVGCSIKARKI
jgi:peroxiredoxin